MKVKIANARKAWLVVIAALVFSLAAAYYSASNRRPLLVRQAIFEEVVKRRNLLEERAAIEKELLSLKALPRITLRARDLLGMRPPGPREQIVVKKGEDK